MWEVLVDRKVKRKLSAAVHALVGLDREDEVEEIVGVREVDGHRLAECELSYI